MTVTKTPALARTSAAMAIILLMSLLFAACKNYNLSVDDYLDEYTRNAAVDHVEYAEDYPADSEGITSAQTEGPCVITYVIRNPQRYALEPRLSMPSLGTQPVAGTDYTVALAEDRMSVTLTLSRAFIAAHDCGGDISPSLSLYEPVSGRTFPVYSHALRANSAPFAPAGACVMIDGSGHYVVCVNLDLSSPAQADLSTMTVEGSTTALTPTPGATASIAFSNPSFSSSWSGSLATVPGSVATFVPGAGGKVPVYVKTGVPVSTGDRSFAVTIADRRGLTREFTLSTRGEQLLPVRVTDSANAELDRSASIAFDPEARSPEVVVVAPAATSGGGSVSGVTVWYELYADASYSGLLASGSGTDRVRVACVNTANYLKVWATKPGCVDSEVRAYALTLVKRRVYVNPSFAGTGTGSRANPYRSIASAIANLSDPSNTQNTITLLGNIVAPETRADGSENEIALVEIPDGIGAGALNLVINGGGFSVNAGSSSGKRCVYVTRPDSNITLMNLTLCNATAEEGGAGLLFENASSKLTLQNCTVRDNVATQGPSAYLQGAGIFFFGQELSVIGGEITRNENRFDYPRNGLLGSGGGVYVFSGKAEISGARISENSASVFSVGTTGAGYGGGIYAGAGTQLKVINSEIIGNTATKGAGQAYLTGLGGGVCFYGSSFELNATNVRLNTAMDASGINPCPGDGGGIAVQAGTFETLGSVMIRENTASTFGRGVGGGVHLNTPGLCTLNGGTTITQNTGTGQGEGSGGGVYIYGSPGVTFARGCTVSKNVATDEGNGFGGGIYALRTKVTLTGAIVAENTSTGSGEGRGGGFYSATELHLEEDTRVAGNFATIGGGSGFGGGIYQKSDILYLSGSSRVDGNTAAVHVASALSAQGGGVFLDDGAEIQMSGGSISNNFVTDETSLGGPNWKGGGIFVIDGATARIHGGLITGNRILARIAPDVNSKSRGNGIEVGSGSAEHFYMSGSISITPDNVVLLRNGQPIMIDGPLTGDYPVATIMPFDSSLGASVLDERSFELADNSDAFALYDGTEPATKGVWYDGTICESIMVSDGNDLASKMASNTGAGICIFRLDPNVTRYTVDGTITITQGTYRAILPSGNAEVTINYNGTGPFLTVGNTSSSWASLRVGSRFTGQLMLSAGQVLNSAFIRFTASSVPVVSRLSNVKIDSVRSYDSAITVNSSVYLYLDDFILTRYTGRHSALRMNAGSICYFSSGNIANCTAGPAFTDSEVGVLTFEGGRSDFIWNGGTITGNSCVDGVSYSTEGTSVISFRSPDDSVFN